MCLCVNIKFIYKNTDKSRDQAGPMKPTLIDDFSTGKECTTTTKKTKSFRAEAGKALDSVLNLTAKAALACI